MYELLFCMPADSAGLNVGVYSAAFTGKKKMCTIIKWMHIFLSICSNNRSSFEHLASMQLCVEYRLLALFVLFE